MKTKNIIITIAIIIMAVPGMAGATATWGPTIKDLTTRVENLEVAVQALQARNAQLEAGIGATGAVPASLEARVSALERVTKAIQDSLVIVINMLAQALSAINLRV